MIPSTNISKAMIMAQKISEQMAAFDKINSSLAKFDSLKVFTAKNYDGFIDATKYGEIICQSYQKAALDMKFYDKTYLDTFFKKPDITKSDKFYGGGNWKTINSTAFLLHDNNKWTEIDADVFSPNVKVKHLDNWFKSLELDKSGSGIKRLNTLETIRSVAEQNVIEKINSRNKVAHRISNILYSIEGNFQVDTKLDFEKDRFYFDEYDRLYDSLCASVAELILDEAIINSELSKIVLLNKLYKSIKAVLKKIALNKREVFRKINSFHFKNLDDYHSIGIAA